MKPERFGRNLTEKYGTDRDLKWDEICSVLFRFLNWYEMFRPLRAKRNGIDNLVNNNIFLEYIITKEPLIKDQEQEVLSGP